MGLIFSSFQRFFGFQKTEQSLKTPAKTPLKSTIKQSVPVGDYTYSKLTRECIHKGPQSHPPGYPLEIADCLESSLYILDVSSQITVDATQKCTLVFGPAEGSIFLRDCHDCVVICAGQQLR